MKDLSEIMRQAQAMQSKMLDAQSRMEQVEATGSAGGGLVRVTLKGKGALESVSIDPSLMSGSEVEIVEDLVKAAHDDARRRLDQMLEDAMKDVTQGFGGMMPGFKLPF
jgi:nucleoid-associated protein EbfC